MSFRAFKFTSRLDERLTTEGRGMSVSMLEYLVTPIWFFEGLLGLGISMFMKWFSLNFLIVLFLGEVPTRIDFLMVDLLDLFVWTVGFLELLLLLHLLTLRLK
jgi:hypothetical protein